MNPSEFQCRISAGDSATMRAWISEVQNMAETHSIECDPSEPFCQQIQTALKDARRDLTTLQTDLRALKLSSTDLSILKNQLRAETNSVGEILAECKGETACAEKYGLPAAHAARFAAAKPVAEAVVKRCEHELNGAASLGKVRPQGAKAVERQPEAMPQRPPAAEPKKTPEKK